MSALLPTKIRHDLQGKIEFVLSSQHLLNASRLGIDLKVTEKKQRLRITLEAPISEWEESGLDFKHHPISSVFRFEMKQAILEKGLDKWLKASSLKDFLGTNQGALISLEHYDLIGPSAFFD